MITSDCLPHHLEVKPFTLVLKQVLPDDHHHQFVAEHSLDKEAAYDDLG